MLILINSSPSNVNFDIYVYLVIDTFCRLHTLKPTHNSNCCTYKYLSVEINNILTITGTALIRAMTYIMQLKGKVDVINMSYGEHSQWSNAGKIGELIGEVVNKHGVIWAVSAGNAGNIYYRFVQ